MPKTIEDLSFRVDKHGRAIAEWFLPRQPNQVWYDQAVYYESRPLNEEFKKTALKEIRKKVKKYLAKIS